MSVAVIGVGLACPLGLVSLPALAAIRAGLQRFDDLDDGHRPVCRLDPEHAAHDPGASRSERAEFFAAAALSELLEFCAWSQPPAVYLAGAEPGVFAGLDVAGVWSRLVARCARSLPRTPAIYPSGRAGAFEALASACAQLEAGPGQLAIVGGFDSLVDAHTLDRLGDDPRIPGEGAAFVLLARADQLGRGSPSALAQLEAVTLAVDPEPYSSGSPCRAAGLSAALADLRARGVTRVDVVHAVTPSEGWWAQEFTYAHLRNVALMPEPLEYESLHDGLGELGAAGGAAAIVRAVRGARPWFQGSHAPVRPRALVYASSDAGRVGVCSLQA